jgi:hypothetical protein
MSSLFVTPRNGRSKRRPYKARTSHLPLLAVHFVLRTWHLLCSQIPTHVSDHHCLDMNPLGL